MSTQPQLPPQTLPLLNHVLTLLQTPQNPLTTSQLQGISATLLSTLSNPLNLSILSAHLLTAPALWHSQPGLAPSLAILSIHHTAGTRVRAGATPAPPGSQTPMILAPLSCDAYAKAILQSLDGRTAPWQHLLVLSGLLLGLATNPTPTQVFSTTPKALSPAMRMRVETTLVSAANRSLHRPLQDGPLAAASMVLSLAYAFPQLQQTSLATLNASALLPVAVAALRGPSGLQDGAFLQAVAADMQGASPGFATGALLNWPEESPSAVSLKALTASPLIGNLGPLSKLMTFAVQAASPAAVIAAQVSLQAMASSLWLAWTSTPLAALEPHSYGARLSPAAASGPVPLLMQTLQRLLFAVTAVLNAVMSRAVIDSSLRRAGTNGGVIATTTLRTLRDLFFIAQRDGNARFQIYRFTYLCAIDMLAGTPRAPEKLLAAIKTDGLANAATGIPADTPTRLLDLYYLNLAEHLPLSLSPSAADLLILTSASRFLPHDAPPSPLLRELFEAAHAATLAVLSCPAHAVLAARLVPFYAAQLLNAFPTLVSPRQFRLAVKTVVSILAPPAPASAVAEGMAEGLAEGLRFRAVTPGAGTVVLGALAGEEATAVEKVSEQTGLLLALVDALPNLPLTSVREWLSATAEAITHVVDPELRVVVAKRFWEVLESGEMDVEKSMVAVEWWASGGGSVVGKNRGVEGQVVPMMSGAGTGLKDGSHL